MRQRTRGIALFSFALFISFTAKTDNNINQHFSRLNLNTPSIEADKVRIVKSEVPQNTPAKDWTIILYIAADNDLGAFAIRNIKQMASIGSNEHFNIVVQLDIRKSNGEKITRRYYIEKGKVLHLNANDPHSQRMDSGNANTLISCCGWAIENFPAEHYGLILWNHGTGALDPIRGRTIRPAELFALNLVTQKLELDRSIGYLDRMLQRGICWDDSTGNYLSNQKLETALETICTRYLDGEKFLFIGFDACLMQMVEIANIMKKYAHIMIGSEEAELGYGWNYASVLEPFTHGTMGPVDFADHIVQSFGQSYERITSDYTLSALNLDDFQHMEHNINDIANLLLEGFKKQKNNSVKKTIKACRNKLVCTHFDEPSYIDLHHFYSNLLRGIDHIKLNNKNDERQLKAQLKEKLQEGIRLIENLAFAHTEGKNLAQARGLSIYFPEGRMYPSYKNLPFAKKNQWANFLMRYLIL